MPNDPQDDLSKTAEVAAVALDDAAFILEEEDDAAIPIDIGGETRIPPASDSLLPSSISPATLRYSTPLPEDGWLGEDTRLTRATEKTLSIPSKTSADRATMTVITGLHAGQVFALDAGDHVIGRGTEANVWVEDPSISRRHACVSRRSDGRFSVEDLGSTNGTFVSGRRIDGRAELVSGDRVQVGPNLILRFAIIDDAEEELQRRLYESSTRDALTRAFNRKYFSERMVAEVAHARRHKTQLALLMLDLDRFKQVNDTHGHLAGDMVLRVVSAQLQRLIRVEDVLARYGGEEFVILIRSTGHGDAAKLAERVRTTVERLQIAVQPTVTLGITTSLGIASLSELPPEASGTELVAMADARLYRAKVGGRNRVCGTD
jgi:two-component system cell cycle response regulator